MDQPRPCQKLSPSAMVIKIAGVWLCLLSLWLAPRAAAQTTPTPINPISTFQLQEGSSAVSWFQSSATVDSATGNSLISFQDGNGGTSTMTWRSTGTLASWVIYPPSGSPQVYADATAQGRPGSFTLTSGAFGSNNVLFINGHPYVPSGSFLVPAQTSPTDSYPPPLTLFQFGYGGSTYTCATTGTDYNGASVGTFSNQASSLVVTGVQGLQIYSPNGTRAVYSIDSTNRIYTYQTSSSAPNQLSQINGCALAAFGNTLALPLPISSFVWNGMTSTFAAIYWDSHSLMVGAGGLFWEYGGGGVGLLATANSDGSFERLSAYRSSPQFEYQYLTPGTTPNTYNNHNPFGGNPNFFTAINGVPYTLQGTTLVPQGPISTLSYGGSTYQFTGYAQAGDGNWLAQYQTSGANPVTASVEYSPSNDAIVKMSINASAGGTAVYVDGATVGQPGAYVWSNASTAANALSSVNNNPFNPSGNSDLPGTAQTTNGVFAIMGNFMDLGSWTNNSSQAGFSLSYYDGQTATNPASVEFTGNRPLTSWVWDVASQDGTTSNLVMLLDESSRLLLYPQATTQAAPLPVETPSVILDPNPGGTSRFDGPVRIAPQGDLSMGEFTAEPTPAQ